jgi:hypothetical protein
LGGHAQLWESKTCPRKAEGMAPSLELHFQFLAH